MLNKKSNNINFFYNNKIIIYTEIENSNIINYCKQYLIYFF